MLKKTVLAGAVAALATVGAAGVASAHDWSDGHGSGNACDSKEVTHQSNDHNKQVFGGNLDVDRISGGLISGQIDKVPGICPSIGNDNRF
jgi:tryptophanase